MTLTQNKEGTGAMRLYVGLVFIMKGILAAYFHLPTQYLIPCIALAVAGCLIIAIPEVMHK